MNHPLFLHHIEQLNKRGITEETARAAGIYSEPNARALGTALGWRGSFPKKCGPALVFPYTDVEGRNGYCRIKPDYPRVRGGKANKYESPQGRPNQIYLGPGVAEKLSRADAELIITEGEFKTLAAIQAGFTCTIGLVGVDGYTKKGEERILPELERVAWHGRSVRIVFDSDVATNPRVQDAESRLSRLLEQRGARVRVVRLPPGPPDVDGNPTKLGLDDFLVLYGPAALRKLLDEADEPTPVDPAVMRTSARHADPAEEVHKFLEEGIVDGVSRLRFWGGSFWLYRRGCYSEVPTSEVCAQVVRYMNQGFRDVTTSVTGNLMNQLKAQSLLPSYIEAPKWLENPPRFDDGSEWPAEGVLVCRNGMIHLPSFTARRSDYFHKATPRLFSTVALDYAFDPQAPLPAAWLEFLLQLWPDDEASITLLQEWFGLSLVLDTRFQKILLMVGPKRSGKGTIARVLRAMVGPDNVAAPTLAGLATQFGLWPLLGKSVALVSDARLSGRTDQAIVVERLLSISGEDAQTIDRKMMEPVTTRLKTRITIITNELPKFADASGALASRMIPLKLTNSFYGREDHGLTDRLLLELPGILLWAIRGWHRLTERGRFEPPASGQELTHSLEDLASPVGAFVKDACFVGADFRVAVSEIFNAWGRWCDAMGRKDIGTEQSFGRDLRAVVPGIIDVRPKNDGERWRAYQGVGLRADF